MKKGVVIVNTARGAVIDEAALVKALDSGHVASVGLDVYENEPQIHPGLISNPHVMLVPHLGTWTVEVSSMPPVFKLPFLLWICRGECVARAASFHSTLVFIARGHKTSSAKQVMTQSKMLSTSLPRIPNPSLRCTHHFLAKEGVKANQHMRLTQRNTDTSCHGGDLDRECEIRARDGSSEECCARAGGPLKHVEDKIQGNLNTFPSLLFVLRMTQWGFSVGVLRWEH